MKTPSNTSSRATAREKQSLKEKMVAKPASITSAVGGVIAIALAAVLLGYIASIGFVNVDLLEIVTFAVAIGGIAFAGFGFGTMRFDLTK